MLWYPTCLRLYRRLGDRMGEAWTHRSLGGLASVQGRPAEAIGHAEQALDLYRAIGNEISEAETLNNIGYCHAQLGDYQRARVLRAGPGPGRQDGQLHLRVQHLGHPRLHRASARQLRPGCR